MKKITLFILLLINVFYVNAQETLYVISGTTIDQFDIATEVDSIIFYEPTIDPVSIVDGDVNGDGELNILVIGTSLSIKPGAEEFNSAAVVSELQSILSQDANLTKTPYVQTEDIYKSKTLTTAIGGLPYNTSDATYFCHSLMQYYYWPEGMADRKSNLMGSLTKDWDYVVLCADPYLASTLPGFYGLGVNELAEKINQGGAKTLLMMMWPKETTNLNGISHFEEFTYRASNGASTPVETIPAGLAWSALPVSKKDVTTAHPSPNGAYLAASSIYSHILNRSASTSNYSYDTDTTIADTALSTINSAKSQTHYTGERSYLTPFSPCNITDNVINYNETGTSTEDRIYSEGLTWIFGKSPLSLVNGGTSPIEFNYGRSNVYFTDNHYNVDPSKFQFTIGFPMQDHKNTGNTTMHYGIDKRSSYYRSDPEQDNGVDVRTATYMIDNNELPTVRAIPIRTLMLKLKEANVITTAYSTAYNDNWHLNATLNKAIAGYMLTLLTGNCDLGTEPADSSSAAWKDWAAHKIGYETAWRLMYLKQAPTCN